MTTDATNLEPVIAVNNLAIGYGTRGGEVRAVRDVSFAIRRGETLGIVGESGCGKSTVAYALVGYLGRNGRVAGGTITFQGQSLVNRSEDELRRLRGNRIAMVYQDPMTSLNPVLRIGEQMSEALTVHQGMTADQARVRCVEMLARVYMPDPERVLKRFPHQISGGQQQRIVIAMALLNNPALLIMDEPTTALDVTVEAAVLDLIADLRRDFDTAMLFISHNLGVIARVSDNVGVMYAGEMVETAPVGKLFKSPRHPYTQGLLRAIPRLGSDKTSAVLHPIPGRVPAPDKLPPGCAFAPRCMFATDACRSAQPMFEQLPAEDTRSEPHSVRCIRVNELADVDWRKSDEDRQPLENQLVSDERILSIEDVRSHYKSGSSGVLGAFGIGKRDTVKAVDGVSFDLIKGKTLGVVGESGSGKSTLIKSIIGLEDISGGKAQFVGFDIGKRTSERDLNLIRELQMVFQNPEATMNPAYTIGAQIERPLRRFNVVPRDKVREEVVRLLRAVKLDEHYYDRLPRQLSGGEKQRVGIARAFAGRPDLVLADEPVSALDVSVQAAVLNLIMDIQSERGTTMIFIAHDLSVVRFLCDMIAVMYLGKIVEIGPAEAIYRPPFHPYTESLLAAVPVPDPEARQTHIRLEGSVPSAVNPPSGCRFHTRCPRRALMPDGGARCEQETPPWREGADGHRIFCHLPLETLAALGTDLNQEKRSA
jgi:peptide/nickel transport system ATP-binding protein